MGIFKGMARRKFMKYAAAGAGAAAANRFSVGGKAFAQDKVILPPSGKKFPDVELTYFQDSNWLHAPLWLSPTFQKDAGVGIKSREMYEGGDTMAKVLSRECRRPRLGTPSATDEQPGQPASGHPSTPSSKKNR